MLIASDHAPTTSLLTLFARIWSPHPCPPFPPFQQGYLLCTHVDKVLVGRALLQAANVEVRFGQLLRLLWRVARTHRVVCVGRVAQARAQGAALRAGVGRAARVRVAGRRCCRHTLSVL